MAFWAENFAAAMVVLESGWKLCIHTMYNAWQLVMCECLPILRPKLAFFGFYLVHEKDTIASFVLQMVSF